MVSARNAKKSLIFLKEIEVLLFIGQVRTDASIVLDSVLYEDPVDLIDVAAKMYEQISRYCFNCAASSQRV